MKIKSRIVIMIISAIALLSTAFFIGTGFIKRTDVSLIDYSVSEDGTILNFNIGISSSMGYVRGFKNKDSDINRHYLVFYSTFGGFNSSFGANNKFQLKLDENDTEIYFNRAYGEYELILQKNKDTGEWLRP